MSRDTKGKFKKIEEDEADFLTDKLNLFDRPPSVKLLFFIFAFFWVVSIFLPGQRELMVSFKGYICNHPAASNSTTTPEGFKDSLEKKPRGY